MDAQLAHARLTRLVEINQLLMNTMDPNELLQAILASALQLFSAAGCSIALIDDTAQQLRFAFVLGGARVEEFRIRLGQGLIGWVAQTGQGVVSNDVTQDPRFFGNVDRRTGFRTKSVLCAPLKQGDEIIGAIEVLNTTDPQGFTPEDLQLLMAFGGLAATAITRAATFSTVQNSQRALQEIVQDRYRLVVGTSSAMQEAIRLARTVAATHTTVLLLGESGTGKEVVARAIHQWSPRAECPFVAVNCVALTPELLESELFGHEKGAFTGAIAQKKGKFELAEGGTIFLDEVGDLAPTLQAKLLRVLQEKEFQRVGGVRDIRVNVRILAATNRDLQKAMQSGTFREDLYYRLNVVSITLPALRERAQDIPVLAQHFLARYCQELKRAPLSIDEQAMALLQAHPWPGNVRELQNAIERAVVFAAGPRITPADLPVQLQQPSLRSPQTLPPLPFTDHIPPLMTAVNEFKRALIRRALQVAQGNQTRAATLLGLRQANLSRMMKTLGIR
ncbi:MAG: sigma 54-interacting transcriptional regulator [Candidatus Binatia bacterium]|nr:sigma 54-interacting transcriptional regulator [Candidatus Binatia bacterium]